MKLIFREKLKINDEKSETSSSRSSWKQKCRKWVRSIGSVFGLLAFLTLIGIVIYHILHINTPCSNCGLSYENKTRTYSSTKLLLKCTLRSDCKVECDNIKEDKEKLSVADYINNINEDLEKNSCNAITELTIMRTKFKQYQLDKGWLEGIKPKIKQLKFLKCTLTKINQEAFAGHPFSGSLHLLRIVDADVENLKKESFQGLSTLSSFAFCEERQPRTKRLKLERDILVGMSNTLSSLEFAGYVFSAEDIQNLIGDKVTSFIILKTLALQENTILDLGEYSFTGAPSLELLSLVHVGLKKIDQKAFWGANSIKKLNLKNNLLETIPRGAFNGLKKLEDKGINLSDNRWRCDCSLQWLQKDYKNKINQKEAPLCADEENNGKTFDQAEFCPESSTVSSTKPNPEPSTSSTTSATAISPSTGPSPASSTSSSESTVGLPSEYITIKCEERKKSAEDAKVDVVHKAEVTIRRKNIELSIHELEGDPLEVEIRTAEDLSDYHLLWLNAENKSESGCRSPVEDKMVISVLRRGTTYSFGLLYGNDSQVSPNCTFCIKTEPEWKLRAWIFNKYQAGVIASTVFIGIFLIFLTALITFLCIRQHPKVIASNKSVIIVKPKKDSEEATPSRDYEKPAYWDPYLIPSSQGYLTPKFHRYSKVKYRPPLMRSISEWSLTSANQTVYDDPRYSQALQMLRELRQNPKEVLESDVYDYRPPLPPPNPGSKRPSTPPQEELYSSV